MITSDGCLVVGAAEGDSLRGAAGAATLLKVDGVQSGNLLEVFEQAAPAGSGPPLHIHRHCAETLYVLSGDVRFELGSELVTAPTGTIVFVPKGVPHTYMNVGRNAGRILFWFTPAAEMASYFRELAAFPFGPPSDGILDEIASRHGVEIVRKSGDA